MAKPAHSTACAAVEYYVYVYWRSDLSRETPFYVGKGKGNRARKRDSRNPDFLAIVDSLAAAGTPARVEMTDFMTEREALDLEIELIEFYGRADRSSGPLVNRTAGGDGIKFVSVSPEMRAKARVQMADLKANPAAEKKRLKGLRDAAKRPELLEYRRQLQIKRYADNDARKEHGLRMKEIWEREGFKAAQAAGLSKAWEDTEHRAKVIAGIKKSLAEGGAEQRSKTMKSKFVGEAGEARRARVAAQSAARWADPAYREKMKAANQAAWDNDDGSRKAKARRTMLSRHGRLPTE